MRVVCGKLALNEKLSCDFSLRRSAFMTVAVLACPFLCSGTVDSAGTEKSEPVCRGFHAPSDSDGGKPARTRLNLDIAIVDTCICRGAVMIGMLKCRSLTVERMLALDGGNMPNAVVVRSNLPAMQAACHFSAAESGREIRTTASLLL